MCSPEGVAAQPVQTPKTQKVQKTQKLQKKAKPKAKAKAKVVLGKTLGNTPAVKALANRLSAEHQLPKAWVQKQIASARLLPEVQQMVLPPISPTAKNWQAYRARFLQTQRIQAGVAFARLYEEALKSAEARYGVPTAHVLGVLGVETVYGQ
jgi:membrane-bound lytic murein transglycosylase B